jgi:amicyanin
MKTTFSIALAFSVLGIVFLSGCTTQPSVQNNLQPNNVYISNFAFNPGELKVKAGDTVTWTNQDSTPHRIISDTGNELNSQILSQGGTYSHTFNQAGTFTYHCSIHTYMKGTVTVG